MNSRPFIYVSALLACLPAVLLVALFVMPTGLEEIGLPLVGAFSMLTGVVFAVHAFRVTSLSTEDKVLWSIGMTLVSPALLAPAYWFQQVRPDLDWHRFRELSRA